MSDEEKKQGEVHKEDQVMQAQEEQVDEVVNRMADLKPYAHATLLTVKASQS